MHDFAVENGLFKSLGTSEKRSVERLLHSVIMVSPNKQLNNCLVTEKIS